MCTGGHHLGGDQRAADHGESDQVRLSCGQAALLDCTPQAGCAHPLRLVCVKGDQNVLCIPLLFA
jgi:hypothetical protein